MTVNYSKNTHLTLFNSLRFLCFDVLDNEGILIFTALSLP